MTTCYTKVANENGKEVVLKMSNAGVHIKVKSVKRGECYTITPEPNATYREYRVGEVEGTPIVFSSDDCLKNEEVIIKTDGEFQMNKRSDLKVVNTFDTEFKVTRRGGNGTPDVKATLQKDEECRIAYDSETNDSFSVESPSTLDEKPSPIKPEAFVKSTKLKIVSNKPGNAKVQTAESRPAPATASTCSIL